MVNEWMTGTKYKLRGPWAETRGQKYLKTFTSSSATLWWDSLWILVSFILLKTPYEYLVKYLSHTKTRLYSQYVVVLTINIDFIRGPHLYIHNRTVQGGPILKVKKDNMQLYFYVKVSKNPNQIEKEIID